MSVCLSPDDYIRELQEDRGEAVWVATLSDGSLVYQDDGRPGTVGPAWLRLREHVRRNRLRIKGLHLWFRSNRLYPLPDDADGYFFSRSVLSFFGGPSHAFYVVGAYSLTNDQIVVQRVKVPELISMDVETRYRIPGSPTLITSED